LFILFRYAYDLSNSDGCNAGRGKAFWSRSSSGASQNGGAVRTCLGEHHHYHERDESAEAESRKGPEMAQKVQVITYSDLSGEEGASSITFGFSGSTYEIDLTGKEQDELAALLQPYVASGRRISGRGNGKAAAPQAARRGKAAAEKPNPRDVRAWAAKKGIKVSDRGRVPANVIERYLAEH
jgi:hypothetical protein